MMLKRVGIREIDRVGLMGIFCNICKVQAESFAKATELDLAYVFEAKLEGLMGDLLRGVQLRAEGNTTVGTPDKWLRDGHCF